MPTNLTLLKQDAGNRAWRTFLQNIAIDVVVAVVAILVPYFQKANSFGDFEWTVIIFSVVKTIALTAFAFIMRRFLDPSSFPTPLPPAPVAAPNELDDPNRNNLD
jgi:Na+/melibiose symporter-like transporter